MAVTGLEVADVAVLINGFDFRIYEVPADKDIHEVLFESQEKFWEGVVNRTPPEPRTLADMKESDTLINVDFILATCKATKPGKRLDGKNFQTEYPDLYEKYTYPTPPTRQFLINTKGTPGRVSIGWRIPAIYTRWWQTRGPDAFVPVSWGLSRETL
jgi:predicted phage-related endonuclease